MITCFGKNAPNNTSFQLARPWRFPGGIWFLAVLFASLSVVTLGAQIKPMVKTGTTRAVIIGISDYQNEQITDLRFAHADAEVFADFLRAPAGGSVPAENIMLLTNEQATQGQMASALTWLMEESKPEDRAIIYFAGHGDVETKPALQLGFLLTYDAPATTYMGGGAFPVFMLQSVISALTTQQVQVILITDACRAGKLAGNEIGGTHVTAEALARQFTNSVNILSCQPNEFSLEGEEWGGGHGVFSYYLLDGLEGLADNNEDWLVNLKEIGRYLEDNVSAATAPHPQNPMTRGDREFVLARVDEQTLAQLKAGRGHPADHLLAGIGSRGTAGVLTDTTARKIYLRFEKALASRHLLYPQEESAYALYQQLIGMEATRPLQGLMKRNLAAALQDDAQQAINDYLAADPRELRRRWNYDDRYEHFPEYLGKSAELLGEGHFMYKNLRARQAYFKGLNRRLQGERDKQSDLYQEAVALQQEALGLDSSAAYAFNELGILARRVRDYPLAATYFQQAIALSPQWVLPHANLCGTYVELGQLDQAETTGRLAVQLDSTFALANYNLALTYERSGNAAKAIFFYQRTIALDPEYVNAYYNLALVAYFQQDFQQARQIWLALGERVTDDPWVFHNIGQAEINLGKPDSAMLFFRKALAIDPGFQPSLLSLGMLYREQGEMDKAEAAFKQFLQPEPADPEGAMQGYICLAGVLAMQGRSGEALENLEKALEKGFNDPEQLLADPYLAPLRDLPSFAGLLERLRR